MLKRLISILLICIFTSFTVFASNSALIKTGDEFFVLGEDKQVAEILNLTEDDIYSHCEENSIIYFAVNQNRSKQIQVTRLSSEFTKNIGNLSYLDENEIQLVAPQLIGVDGIKGEIIDKRGQLFILAKSKTEDSGGNYTLTQYITVAGENKYILSFYTGEDADEKYIKDVFDSFNANGFIDTSKTDGVFNRIVVPVLLVFFAAAALGIVFTIVRDLKHKKEV